MIVYTYVHTFNHKRRLKQVSHKGYNFLKHITLTQIMFKIPLSCITLLATMLTGCEISTI